MKSQGFRRFVAVFVGILLALGVYYCVITGDESMIGMCAVLGVFYVIYMVKFIRKEKEQREQSSPKKESPLIRH